MISMTWPQALRREVAVDGRAIRLSPLEHDVVAAILMAPPDRELSTPDLIERVWPNADTQPECARQVLRSTVSRARRRGVPILSANWKGYSLPR